MDFAIDLSGIINIFNQPAHEILLKFLFNFGWIPLFILYLYAAKELWLQFIQTQFSRKQRYVFLAIDVPRANEQSPKAVENVFSYLAGAHMAIDFFERWWKGEWQLRFSLEVVSIDGYVQYIIRTPVHWRDLVESAVYSQYPDAEITEINDYTIGLPSYFPNDEYDLNGAEYTYVNAPSFPIKTYRHFEIEHPAEGEASFKDPNASLMALMQSMRPGEQLWYQILIQPIGFDWMGMAENEIKKVFGEAVKKKKGILEGIADIILQILHDFGEMIYKLWGDVKEPEKKEEKKPKTMIELTPAEKKKVEGIEEKVSKLAFNTKIRYVYIAKKDIFDKVKAFSGFVGYMKQFIDLDLNSLKPDMELTMTRAHYFMVEERRNFRKRKLMRGYRTRDGVVGKMPMIMNIEELATLWHFPIESAVKAPLLQKAPGRKAEAPMSLPIEAQPGEEEQVDFFEDIRGQAAGPGKKERKSSSPSEVEETELDVKGQPPANLPFA